MQGRIRSVHYLGDEFNKKTELFKSEFSLLI